MNPAGCSGAPLAKKLGFETGDSVFVEDTAGWYSRFADEHGLELTPGLPAAHAHLFFSSRAELESFALEYDLEDIEKSLWVSWPKKS
jgi:hypothetical protein